MFTVSLQECFSLPRVIGVFWKHITSFGSVIELSSDLCRYLACNPKLGLMGKQLLIMGCKLLSPLFLPGSCEILRTVGVIDENQLNF